MELIEEVFTYKNEYSDEQRKKLQNICDVINPFNYNWQDDWTVENFVKGKYSADKTRLVNQSGDIWLMYYGGTDGTHAPAGFLESTYYIYYFKGFTVQLNFEEQAGGKLLFLLETVDLSRDNRSIGIDELFNVLDENNIDKYDYISYVQQAISIWNRKAFESEMKSMKHFREMLNKAGIPGATEISDLEMLRKFKRPVMQYGL
ncbi:hypothetical protein [Stenoxybacter acetivorans]|uniref:hypothetical protein n=1 Tax=Stenoxybacter acetivorans TaxID=422441 RepID=UPI00055F27FD|nr:hypothetical protein [Stenoxybacter acetivorans]